MISIITFKIPATHVYKIIPKQRNGGMQHLSMWKKYDFFCGNFSENSIQIAIVQISFRPRKIQIVVKIIMSMTLVRKNPCRYLRLFFLLTARACVKYFTVYGMRQTKPFKHILG